MAKLNKIKVTQALKEIEESYEDAVDYYMQHRDVMQENFAFYLGYQHRLQADISQSDATGEAVETRNYIRPTVRSALAALLRQTINPEVAAPNGDRKSRAKADATQLFIRSFISAGIVDPEEQISWILDSKIMGLGWLKVFWDPTAGKPIQAMAEDPEADTNEFGELLTQSFEGEIKVEHVPMMDCLFAPHIRSTQELKQAGAYVIHRKRFPLRYLERRFKYDMFGDSAEGRFGQTNTRYSVEETAAENWSGIDSRARSPKNKLAELCEYWENPSSEYPNGRLMIWSGQCVLYYGPNLYVPARLPFIPLRGDNVVPTRLRADGVVEDLKSVQETANRAASKKREWIDKMLNGRIYVPYGAGIDPNALDDVTGRIVEYQRGLEPKETRPPDVPGSLFSTSQETYQEIKDLSTYTDVSQGTTSPNSTTGRAMYIANEMSERARAAEVTIYKKAMTEVLQHCVWLARQFYEEGRNYRILGSDGKWMEKTFKAGDLELGRELVIDITSNAPSNPAMRTAEVMEMFSAGLLDPENPAAKIAREILADNYISRSTYEQFPEAKNKAKRHIMAVLEDPLNANLTIQAFDNHAVYLEEVNKWRQTEEYEALPDWQKQIIDGVAEQAEMYLAAQEQQMADSMQMMSGGGGGGEMSQPTNGAPAPMDGGSPLAPEEAQGPEEQMLQQDTSLQSQ